MQQPPPLPSDGQLIGGTRTGMPGAWAELVRRHAPAVTGLARARRRFGAKKAVATSLEAFRGEIDADEASSADRQPEGGDEVGVAGGVRAVRPRLIAGITGNGYGPGSSIDGSVADLELVGSTPPRVDLEDLESIARAFTALPEPWQTALWHRVVEQQTAAEYAPLLGRAANDAASAVQRADAGLFEHYLIDQRANSDVAPACEPIIPLLGGALRSTLSAHEQRLVASHLAGSERVGRDADATDDARPSGCGACNRRVAVSRELATLLPAAIVPRLTGLGVEKYREASGARSAVAVTDPGERRRRFAFVAIFSALVLAAAGAVLFARDSLDTSEADPPVSDLTATTDGDDTDPATTVSDNAASTPTTTDEPAPTTTELQLRPPSTGPSNAIDIVFDEPAAVGFAPGQTELSVVLSSPGPVFAGGTGTIDVAITNSGDSDVDTGAAIQVPPGVIFDGLIAGVGDCVDPDDDSARCSTSVPAGGTELLTVRFRLESAVVGQFVVDSNLAAEPVELPITAIRRLVHSSVDRGEIITAGNTLMTCVETAPACLDARDGVGDIVNRWDLPAEFVGADRGPDWLNSSSATVDLGGGVVDAAYLFWSGDLSERDVVIPDDGRSSRVSVLPPGADEAIEFDAARVRLGDIDATQYFGSVEVTDLLAEYGSGDYVVGNVQSAEVQGSYAAWSLVVVTRDESLPRRSNVIISPFSWFSPDDDYAIEIVVPFGDEHDAHLDVVAFEGERGFVPERLVIAGEVLGDAVFDSSIEGAREPSFDNNFGIDIDAYDLVIDASTGSLPIEATSDDDGIRLAVLALAVDVE